MQILTEYRPFLQAHAFQRLQRFLKTLSNTGPGTFQVFTGFFDLQNVTQTQDQAKIDRSRKVQGFLQLPECLVVLLR